MPRNRSTTSPILIEAYGGPAHGVMLVCEDDFSPKLVEYGCNTWGRNNSRQTTLERATYLWQDIRFLWCVGECVPLDGVIWEYKALVWEESLKREEQYDILHGAQLRFNRAYKASNFRG